MIKIRAKTLVKYEVPAWKTAFSLDLAVFLMTFLGQTKEFEACFVENHVKYDTFRVVLRFVVLLGPLRAQVAPKMAPGRSPGAPRRRPKGPRRHPK